MVNEKSVKRALDARLSALTASPQRRARILNAALKKEKPIMKKKITAGAAIVLAALLVLTGAALAVGSNLFHALPRAMFVMKPFRNQQSARRNRRRALRMTPSAQHALMWTARISTASR